MVWYGKGHPKGCPQSNHMEAAPGFEPGVKALQASALPLGHFAEKGPLETVRKCNGADNGARTRDPNLGKVVLYQLSHVRLRESTIRNQTIMCKSFFMIVYAAGVILGVVQTATACPHGHAATSPHRCRGDEFLPQGSLACVSRRHPPRDRCAVICVKPEIRLLFQTILKKMEKVVDRTLVSGLY